MHEVKNKRQCTLVHSKINTKKKMSGKNSFFYFRNVLKTLPLLKLNLVTSKKASSQCLC